MHFSHSAEIWREHPDLTVGALYAPAIAKHASVDRQIPKYEAIARARLASGSEGELPEIQAWRRAFSKMSLKPTQYRCASESLLRRFRKEGRLPRIHPLIDLCNAVSLAFAIPIAVFDASQIANALEVRHATGEETYLAFSGEVERPEDGEVIFADALGRAHARRWTHRQAAYSAIRDETSHALIVAEAMHSGASEDVRRLVATLAEEIAVTWGAAPMTAILDRSSPGFEC